MLRYRGSPRRPPVGTITAARRHNMKELRSGSAGRSGIRILFAFDLARMEILLTAGDKAGSWTQRDKKNILHLSMIHSTNTSAH
ncbi:type II toxin-antitoxin system RelE/ParE family toxin [uncultured Propionibacterium sp.]|uniref:type II toxin-antitoxin system RelE/ParE family toxin n=1 Tax=uncultured Propionibacterium sp. TaxID=218066 RepID=UPI00292CE344|nr:type II toxin-antitoxin system RelE/ParE family toxin [uncultured Propionibacterium sp.]